MRTLFRQNRRARAETESEIFACKLRVHVYRDPHKIVEAAELCLGKPKRFQHKLLHIEPRLPYWLLGEIYQERLWPTVVIDREVYRRSCLAFLWVGQTVTEIPRQEITPHICLVRNGHSVVDEIESGHNVTRLRGKREGGSNS